MSHMDVFECIAGRRSIHKFLQTPIEFDKLTQIMRAGMYAPCSGNQQNWKFILEVNREKIKSIHPLALDQDCFLSAPACIIVVAETEKEEKFFGMRGKRLYAIQNCAAATQNILLAAHALGLGAVWIGAFDENKLNDMYSVPPSARIQSLVLIGYADEVPQPRQMKDLWYLVNFDKYGNKYQHHHRVTHDMSAEWTLQGKRAQNAIERMGSGKEKGEDQNTQAKVKEAGEQAKNFLKVQKDQAKKLLDKLKKDPPKSRK